MLIASGHRSSLIALNRLPRVGASKVRSLERVFGSLTEAARQDPETIALRCKDIGPALAAEVVVALNSHWAEDEERRAASCHVQIVTWEDDAYPEVLRNIDAPPLCLYCAGDLTLLRQPQVAIIGTRRASIYGTDQAQRFAMRLAESGIHVLSGLAEGIDSAAHQGALLPGQQCCGKTIAIIGAALDCVYPASRKPLAREIVRSGGLVLSEYPFGRHADRKTFPQRNRIVAALAKSILVVESPYTSGTMITVDYAKAMGRAVYAIPGRCDWPNFAGNHHLLRSGEAQLVTSPEHILETFSQLDLREGHPMPSIADEAPIGLSPEELKIYHAVDTDGTSLDTLCERTELPMPTVMSLTVALQMRRILRPLPGGRVRK